MTSFGHLHEVIDKEEQEKELEEGIKKDTDQVEIERAREGKKVLLASEKGKLLELSRYIHQDPSLINYADSDGYTPLHRACYGDHIDCVKYLLKRGADINAKTSDDWTPLHCAVRWNNIAVAEYLINQGADINAKSCGGNTPLHIVASNGCYSITCDLIQLLLYHPNCDFLAKNSSGDTAYDIAKRSGPFYKFWTGVMTLASSNTELND